MDALGKMRDKAMGWKPKYIGSFLAVAAIFGFLVTILVIQIIMWIDLDSHINETTTEEEAEEASLKKKRQGRRLLKSVRRKALPKPKPRVH